MGDNIFFNAIAEDMYYGTNGAMEIFKKELVHQQQRWINKYREEEKISKKKKEDLEKWRGSRSDKAFKEAKIESEQEHSYLKKLLINMENVHAEHLYKTPKKIDERLQERLQEEKQQKKTERERIEDEKIELQKEREAEKFELEKNELEKNKRRDELIKTGVTFGWETDVDGTIPEKVWRKWEEEQKEQAKQMEKRIEAEEYEAKRKSSHVIEEYMKRTALYKKKKKEALYKKKKEEKYEEKTTEEKTTEERPAEEKTAEEKTHEYHRIHNRPDSRESNKEGMFRVKILKENIKKFVRYLNSTLENEQRRTTETGTEERYRKIYTGEYNQHMGEKEKLEWIGEIVYDNINKVKKYIITKIENNIKPFHDM